MVTGHKAYDKRKQMIPWNKLSKGADTLVILMGLGNLEHIVDQLIRHGRSPSTPVAAISHGTTVRERCVTGTLKNIVVRVRKGELTPPSVVVVGEVVRLRKNLRWFNPIKTSKEKS